jgi:hypothetical protein
MTFTDPTDWKSVADRKNALKRVATPPGAACAFATFPHTQRASARFVYQPANSIGRLKPPENSLNTEQLWLSGACTIT